MALIDRVKERIESDLTDPELQLLIDEANAAVIAQHGPHADPLAPITVIRDGHRRTLDFVRPIDDGETVTITETVGTDDTTLAADDWRLRNRGRTLERLDTGTNARFEWGRVVSVTYTPVNDGNERQEAIIKLVQLAVEFEGVESRRIGDHQQSHADYVAERERILGELSQRRGLLVR